VAGQSAITFRQHRIVQRGRDHASLQVVDDDALWNAVERAKGVLVAAQPGSHLLVPDELDVLVSGPGQRHHEHPDLAHPSRPGVSHGPGVAEVHLRFFARRGFDATHRFHLFGVHALDDISLWDSTYIANSYRAKVTVTNGSLGSPSYVSDATPGGLLVRVKRTSSSVSLSAGAPTIDLTMDNDWVLTLYFDAGVLYYMP